MMYLRPYESSRQARENVENVLRLMSADEFRRLYDGALPSLLAGPASYLLPVFECERGRRDLEARE